MNIAVSQDSLNTIDRISDILLAFL